MKVVGCAIDTGFAGIRTGRPYHTLLKSLKSAWTVSFFATVVVSAYSSPLEAMHASVTRASLSLVHPRTVYPMSA